MDLSGMMSGLLKEKAISAISKKLWIKSTIVAGIVWKALPVILSKLKDNSDNSEEKESLQKAVEKNDWSVLDNLDNVNLEDWEKIIWHIFWDKKWEIEEKIWDKKVLSALAPMVMWALWKANSESWESANSLLSSNWMIANIAKSFLDKDWDWDIKDDLMWMAMWFLGKK